MFSEELKLAVVQYVLEGHTRKEASEKFCVSCTPIEKWVNLYKLHGAKNRSSRQEVLHMARRNRTPEENARRETIRGLLLMANIGSMDDIQTQRCYSGIRSAK